MKKSMISALLAVAMVGTISVSASDIAQYPAQEMTPVEGYYNSQSTLDATLISRFAIGGSDEDGGLVEIVAYNTDAKVAYVVAGSAGQLVTIPMADVTTAGLSGTGVNMAELVGTIDGFVYSADIAGDVAPEGLCFVNASDSATGNALLLAANEVSGTLSVIEVSTYTAPVVEESQVETPVVTEPMVVAPVVSSGSYTVALGDCLWSIAVKELGSGLRWSDILALNTDISNASLLQVGQVLTLPGN